MFGQRLSKITRNAINKTVHLTSVPKLNGGLNTTHDKTVIGDNQLSDALNVWWRHGALRSRPGFSKTLLSASVSAPDKVVYWKFPDADVQYRAEDNNWDLIFRHGTNTQTWVPQTLNPQPVPVVVQQEGVIYAYLTDGAVKYNGATVSAASPTAPVVLLNGKPSLTASSLNGSTFVGYNRLTGAYKAKYTSDNTGAIYSLPTAAKGITVKYTDQSGTTHTSVILATATQATTSITVTVGGVSKTGYWFTNPNRTIIWFGETSSTPLVLPAVGFSGNIEVTTEKATDDYSSIAGCTLSAWFGGTRNSIGNGSRLFVAGNPDAPSTIYWSDVGDPLYFPENNYAIVGDGKEKITNLCQLGEYLVIFTEKSIYAMQYVSNTVTAEDIANGYDAAAIAAYFPITQIASPAGCDTHTACLVNNRIVWMNTNGEAWCLTGLSQFDERFIRKIDEEVAMTVSSSATAYSDGEYYYCLSGQNIYVLFAEDWRNYQWYKWQFPLEDCYTISNGGITAWIGGQIYAFMWDDEEDHLDPSVDDETTPVSGTFTTKAFTCGLPHMYKKWHKGYICAAGDGEATVRYNNIPDDPITLGSMYPQKLYPDTTSLSMAITVGFTGRIEIAEVLLKYSIYEEAR